MKPPEFLRLWAMACAVLLLAACGDGDSNPGFMRFALTDAPACGFDEVNISIERIRVHRSADAGANATGWTDLRFSPARRIDLLKLNNGVLEELGQLSLPAGRYAQLRLLLAANGSGTPANSVVPSGGDETALEISSSAQAGIRLVHQVSVTEDKTTDVLFDFDACRSVRGKGSAGYVLQPVVQVVPRTGPSIVGYVDPALSGVAVSAQKAGRVVRGTVTDANGRFVLAYLDSAQSPFDVVLAASGRATAVVSGVPVSTSAGAELSRMDAPITLPAADARSASGTVGPVAARATAAVRALQAVGPATQVEVANGNANVSTGAYSLSLPAAQPRLAAYSTRLPLSFSAAGNAGRYTLEASADAYAAQTQDIAVTDSAATWNPTLALQ
jgi:hypothetical protein